MQNNNLSDYERLLQYGILLISKKRYTCIEIDKKLQQFSKKHELKESDDSEKAINRLIELRYLDDLQYAKDYVSDRIRFKPRGIFLLKRELKLKGVPADISDNVLEETHVDELDMALQLLQKRGIVDAENISQKEKSRGYRFLASKGFNKEIIYKAFQSQYNRN